MLNSTILMGRLTAAPELKTTNNNISVCAFTVAVDRAYQAQGQERQTDFINCVAWRNNADFISRYFTKGQMIAIQGSIQTRNYEDKNGNKRTAVEVIADNVSFCGSKNETGNTYGAANAANDAAASNDSFSVLPDSSDAFPFGADDDEGLPF